jgi:hypothetical protein
MTEGVEAIWASDVDTRGGAGNVPEFVYTPRDTVPATADYGPVGPVAMVFAVPRVRTGLFGFMEHPWVAVSSRDGAYRALSAPHRPAPAAGAVVVSDDGRALAWAFEDGVVLYDPVRDESRVLDEGLPAAPRVGPFSPDGRHLALYDGGLHVLDVETGEVVANLTGVDANAARQAVWTPDGTALVYVDGDNLVTHDWQSDDRTTTPSRGIMPRSPLAWQSSGDQLAAMRTERGVRFVDIFDVGAGGELQPVFRVRPPGFAQEQLFTFTSENRVAVSALRLETATLERVFSMSTVDTTQPSELMQLPGSGIDRGTLVVAAEPLAQGNASFDEPRWPARDLSKLVASIVVTVFVLGLYLTRRPRQARRDRRRRVASTD